MASNRPSRQHGQNVPCIGDDGFGRRLLLEVFGLGLLLWATFLVVILYTYDPSDPSMNHAMSHVAAIRNAGGVFGAYLGGLLVDFFGFGAFAWPMLFIGWGASCVSRFMMPWWRWIGFMLLGAVLTILGSAFGWIAVSAVRGGGVFGDPLIALIRHHAGRTGVLPVCLFLLFLAVELCSGLSWWNGLVRSVHAMKVRCESFGPALRAWASRLKAGDEERVEPVIPLLDVVDGDRTRIVDASCTDVGRREDREPSPKASTPGPIIDLTERKASDEALGEFVWRRVVVGGPDARDPVPEARLEPARNGEDPTPEGVDVSVPEADVHDASSLRDKAADAGDVPADPVPEARPESAGDGEDPTPGGVGVFVPEADIHDASSLRDKVADAGDVPADPVPEARPEPAGDGEACRASVPSAERFTLPRSAFLRPSGAAEALPDPASMKTRSGQLMACLADFNVKAELVRVTPGPVVTMFELRPAPGTKVARILGLHEDIALNLKARAVRIHVMSGSDTVGVEIPNEHRATVNFRSIVESGAFAESSSPLTLVLGVGIGGAPFVADLAKMPHLLVGGSTGSGKSVCINAFLLSLLYKCRPDEMKLLMVDPKRVELSMYADLPHLIHPVVNEPIIAKNALDWAVHEMDRRYQLLARLGVRKFDAYNAKLKEMGTDRPKEFADLEPMPYLVIVIDELADLMMTAGKEVEASIVRLAQLARAAGIHLIVATQRPSVDVVTGLIKANFPSRVSFRVTSVHDSRTILDGTGAELLLGLGDMLFKSGGEKAVRLHGPFVPDTDVEAVVDFWKRQAKPEYTLDFAEWGRPAAEDVKVQGAGRGGGAEDELYGEVVEFTLSQGGKMSISKIQRQFRIGYNKAARFMEQMVQDGVVGAAGHANRPRDVISSTEE